MAKAKAKVKTRAKAAEGIVLEKPRWNIYSTMLLVSLLALLIGCFFLGAELKSYDWKTDPKTAIAP
jgi:hypothetical protein